jgi:hypothetical protein
MSVEQKMIKIRRKSNMPRKMYNHYEFKTFAESCGWCRGMGCMQCGSRYDDYLNEDDNEEWKSQYDISEEEQSEEEQSEEEDKE